MTPTRPPAWLLAALLILPFLAAAPGAAWGHASLIGTTPADGAVLAKAPAAIALTFSEPVSPLVLKLDGAAVSAAPGRSGAAVLDIVPPEGVGPGTHVLTWRVVSEDGHPIGGTVTFSIGAPTSDAAPSPADPIDWPVRAGLWTAKLCLYFGLFLGVGGVFGTVWLTPATRSGGTFALAAVIIGLASLPPLIAFQGLDALGAPLATLAEAIVWRTGFDTTQGRAAILAAAALALALVSLALPRRPARMASLLALATVGLTLAASGHASAAPPQALTRPAVMIHGIGIAAWIGALVPLGVLLAGRSPESVPALRRFSRAAPFVLAPMVASGAILAVIQVEHPSALIGTAYGQVLLVKLALLTALFALAAVNRWRLTGPALSPSPATSRPLTRSIAAELALAVMILGVAACWRFTPPPRVLALAAAQPVQTHMASAEAMADLSVTPGRVGAVKASIVIFSGEFGPLDARSVALTLTDPAVGAEPITRQALRHDDGVWHVDDLTMPRPGRWAARVDIRITDQFSTSLDGEIDIRR